jgi:hypothetical protein
VFVQGNRSVLTPDVGGSGTLTTMTNAIIKNL